MKTLNEVLSSKKFKTREERELFIRTLTVRPFQNNNSHDYPLGVDIVLKNAKGDSLAYLATSVKITGTLTATTTMSSLLRGSRSRGNTIRLGDLHVVSGENSIKDFEERVRNILKERKELLTESKDLKDRIKFMKARGIKKYDESVFKTWNILKEINENKDKLDDFRFAEKLTALIKG